MAIFNSYMLNYQRVSFLMLGSFHSCTLLFTSKNRSLCPKMRYSPPRNLPVSHHFRYEECHKMRVSASPMFRHTQLWMLGWLQWLPPEHCAIQDRHAICPVALDGKSFVAQKDGDRFWTGHPRALGPRSSDLMRVV